MLNYNGDWKDLIQKDNKGKNKCTVNNIKFIIENDPELKDRFARDLFNKKDIVRKSLPWREVNNEEQCVSDLDDAGLRDYLEYEYNITGPQKVKDGLDLIIDKNSFHPIKDYLNSLKWDGKERVNTLFIYYLGANECDYIKQITRKVLAAAVARIFEPGIKFDYVPVIVGKQGQGKSTLIKKLGKQWYSDSFGTVIGKEAFEQLHGVWIMEMGELAGLKKAEMEPIKHFISKQEDRYRVAYGKRTEEFPRQCVFFGTTNDQDFLRDPTGNRRFWPVQTYVTNPIKSIFNDLDDNEIDQIWAEAVQLYRSGEALYLSKEIEEQAREEQIGHREIDDRTGIIQDYLDKLLPSNWNKLNIFERRQFLSGNNPFDSGSEIRTRVCTAEIWCELFGREQSDMTRYNTKSIHDIMKSMPGWSMCTNPIYVKNYGRQRVYRRDDEDTIESNLDKDIDNTLPF